MTKAALARVIGANKVRRRPFKAGVAVAVSRAPSPATMPQAPAPQPPAIKRQAAHSPGATQPA